MSLVIRVSNILIISFILILWPIFAFAETEAVNESHKLVDYVWVIMASALVFLMQAGFMCLESGVAPAKHSINVAIKNIADFIIAVAGFWFVGFGLMFGESIGGWIGNTDYFISIDDPWVALFFIFQAMFVGTAATIDSGAIAGRTRFTAYLFLSFIISFFIYPIFGHWAWGSLLHSDQQGWLEAMGFLDFAGSTVVHSVGAWVGLIGIIVIGPRIGKFDNDGKPQRIPPHSMTTAYLGTFLLFFGWFGFNGGSTLEATPDIAVIILNTLLAGCFGGISASALSWYFSPLQRPEGEMMANGILGGLVAITAGCAFVSAAGAVIIGLVGGIVVFSGINVLEKVFKLDDVVGAVSVHGFAGAWGTIAVGIFMTAEHLGETSRLSQIGVQCLGVLVCFVWTCSITFILLKIINGISPLRVTKDEEMVGLNISEHGARSSLRSTISTINDFIIEGDLSQRVEVEIGTEVGDMAATFNHLLEELEAMSEMAKKIAGGDLLHNVVPKSEQDTLNQAFALMVESLRKIVEQIKTSANDIHQTVGEIAESNEQLSESNSKLASNVTESAKAMDAEIQESIKTTNHAMENMQVLLTKIVDNADSVKSLHHNFNKVAKVVGTIKSIAQQTNMLSLNAAIEAAKAGEKGRGFAVVAERVRELAARSTEASHETTELINMIMDEITLVDAESDEIAKGVSKEAENIGNIPNVLGHIHTSIVKMTDGFAEHSEHSKSVAQTVSNMSQGLLSIVKNLLDAIQVFNYEENQKAIEAKPIIIEE